VLSAAHRLRRSSEFTQVMRHGRRAGRPRLVVHLLAPGQAVAAPPARVGFVVSRAVGSSVIRHRVVRCLRAQMAARMDRISPGSLVVVRALPASAAADSTALGADLDAALARLLRTAVPA
jgi:ribonuclease P protein component